MTSCSRNCRRWGWHETHFREIAMSAAATGRPTSTSAPRRTWGAVVYLRTMLVFALVWALASWLSATQILLPSPLAVLEAVIALARDGELFEHAGISLGR